jgi:hypothetical protein
MDMLGYLVEPTCEEQDQGAQPELYKLGVLNVFFSAVCFYTALQNFA